MIDLDAIFDDDSGRTGTAVVCGIEPENTPRSPESDAPDPGGLEGGADRLWGCGVGLAAATGGSVGRVSVAERFHGGDVEQGKERPPIRVGSGDEDFGTEQGDKIGVADGVRFSAGRDHAERLKRLAVKELADGVLGAHTKSLAARPVGLQGTGGDGWNTWRRRVKSFTLDGRGSCATR